MLTKKTADKSDNFKLLAAFAGVKADLKKITGSNTAYYNILGNHGFEKSSQIESRETAKKIYLELQAAFIERFNAATVGKDNIGTDDFKALTQGRK